MSVLAAAQTLSERYLGVRRFTEDLVGDLSAEDAQLQSMPDASPVKWHLAHTTWFFETFVLDRVPGYRRINPVYQELFNSYYNSVGVPFPRPQRGLLSRPTLEEVREYRVLVDEALVREFDRGLAENDPEVVGIIDIGINHEQQHQELILTDIKHAFSINPLEPALFSSGLDHEDEAAVPSSHQRGQVEWKGYSEGVYKIGHPGDSFAYDNESPRHRVFLNDYQLASDLVTCGQFLEFMEDGGYQRPELWLSEGWNTVKNQGWLAPMYWRQEDDRWSEFTLAGRRAVHPRRPVTHVSYFEADAFARWSGARLPTEAEWEAAAADQPIAGNFADSLLAAGRAPHPAVDQADGGPLGRMYGDVWEWTSSSYAPYPGYQAPPGGLGEYNGKFMCNQYVLRGGSCASSGNHLRASYRNFFAASARWQFSGIRLAR